MMKSMNRGGSRGRVQGVRTPPPPPQEQETSAPPPKKNPGSAPDGRRKVEKQSIAWPVSKDPRETSCGHSHQQQMVVK